MHLAMITEPQTMRCSTPVGDEHRTKLSASISCVSISISQQSGGSVAAAHRARQLEVLLEEGLDGTDVLPVAVERVGHHLLGLGGGRDDLATKVQGLRQGERRRCMVLSSLRVKYVGPRERLTPS